MTSGRNYTVMTAQMITVYHSTVFLIIVRDGLGLSLSTSPILGACKSVQVSVSETQTLDERGKAWKKRTRDPRCSNGRVGICTGDGLEIGGTMDCRVSLVVW